MLVCGSIFRSHLKGALDQQEVINVSECPPVVKLSMNPENVKTTLTLISVNADKSEDENPYSKISN